MYTQFNCPDLYKKTWQFTGLHAEYRIFHQPIPHLNIGRDIEHYQEGL